MCVAVEMCAGVRVHGKPAPLQETPPSQRRGPCLPSQGVVPPALSFKYTVLCGEPVCLASPTPQRVWDTRGRSVVGGGGRPIFWAALYSTGRMEPRAHRWLAAGNTSGQPFGISFRWLYLGLSLGQFWSQEMHDPRDCPAELQVTPRVLHSLVGTCYCLVSNSSHSDDFSGVSLY